MSAKASSPQNVARLLAVTTLVGLTAIATFSAPAELQWTTYGGGADSSRYFSSRQITKANVTQLEAVWTYPYGEAVFHPLIVRGTIYARGRSGALVALDAKTGAVRWKTPRNSTATRMFSFSTPLTIEVDGATQIISPASGFVAAYDSRDGREIWRSRYGEGYSVITRPVLAHGLLFVSSSFDRPVLYAVKPAGAKGDVT
jgi:glucose dehydrogenase